MPKFISGENFILVKERTSRKGNKAICVIRSSGYTIDEKAVTEPWILTQLRTLPKKDRSYLPDPVIAKQTGDVLKPYEETDCNVYSLYAKPECKGIKELQKELAQFIKDNIVNNYEKHALIGHSKGGLIFAGLPLDIHTNMLLIAPTFGTIMGNEELMIKTLDEYKKSKNIIHRILITPDIALYKWVMRTIGSRRPIDCDMSINSDFILKELDLSYLSYHHTMLITATCPKGIFINPTDAFFRHYGKYLGLDKNADGMISIENQKLCEKLVDEVVELKATLPTVLGKASDEIQKFLRGI